MTTNQNGAFALDNVQMALKMTRLNKWGGALVPLNMLTGSRPTMREAPLTKKAKLKIEQGLEKSEFKVSKFKPFKGQNMGANRKTVEEYIDKVISDVDQNQLSPEATGQQLNYLVALCLNKRDIQDGAGERDLSYWMFIHLFYKFPKIMRPLLKLFAFEFGSLLDLNKMSCIIAEDLSGQMLTVNPANKKLDEAKKNSRKNLKQAIIETYVIAFENTDLGQEANAAKWAPRINKSVDRISKLGKDLANALFPNGVDLEKDSKEVKRQKYDKSLKLYRQKIADINKKAMTIEVKMCENDLKFIENNLTKIPGKAMSQYRYTFLDEYKYGQKAKERRRPEESDRTDLREALLSLTKKAIENPELNLIKGGKTMQPHELIRGVLNNTYNQNYEVSPVHEAQWAALRETTKKAGSLKNTVVMSDVSGSMGGIPMEVSIALGLLIAEIQEGIWANRLMTFSSKPEWFSLPACENQSGDLMKKIRAISNMDWGYDTNLEAAMDLILNLAVEYKISNENMPKTFIILTDMCFNAAVGRRNNGLQFDYYKNKFEEKGYDFPAIILWNLRSEDISFQNEADQKGVVNLAGFSIALLKSILEGDQLDLTKKSPIDMLLESLSKGRYDKVFDEIRKVCETEKNDDIVKRFSNFEKFVFEDDKNYEIS